MSVFAGLETGSFVPAVVFPTGAEVGAMVVGDLNGDGQPDLALANPDGGTITILINECQ